MSPLTDLVFFVGATYGLAWLVTQSALFGPSRRVVQGFLVRTGWPGLAEGYGCLICVGTWIAIGIFFWPEGTYGFSPTNSGLFSPWFTNASWRSLPLFLGVWVAGGWTLGRLNGELREEEED